LKKKEEDNTPINFLSKKVEEESVEKVEELKLKTKKRTTKFFHQNSFIDISKIL
jgi:hypothetical protein